jgi:hypothetical protein
MTYRVIYLTRARRTLAPPVFETLERATQYMRALKRRGLTAWVETEHGTFIPVPGAKRQPTWIDQP